MDLREAIRTTGSVRDFRDEPVADGLVSSVLDDAPVCSFIAGMRTTQPANTKPSSAKKTVRVLRS